MTMIKCEYCGSEISDKAVACPYCGTQVIKESKESEHQTYCEECGEPITEGAEACPKCGCPVSKKEETVAETTPQSIDPSENTITESKKGLNKKTKIIIAAVAAAIALVVIGLIVTLIIVTGGKKENDKESKNNEAVTENYTQKTTESQKPSKNDEYVGTWDGFGMIGSDEKLIPIRSGMMEIIIKDSGYWSFTVNGDNTLNYSGDWDVEKLSGSDTLVFYDNDAQVAFGSLNDDGTLGMIFIFADADTLLLFEK